MQKRYISYGDYSVEVHSSTKSVFDFLFQEIGTFFAISSGNEKTNTVLGKIILYTDKQSCDETHKKYMPYAVQKMIFYNGSSKGDLREGSKGKYKSNDVLYCKTTGSLFISNKKTKTVFVYNTNAISAAKDVRRIVRDQIIFAKLQECGSLIVHGAAFGNDKGEGVLILGGSGSGKTTFFTAALDLNKQYNLSFLSCERVILLFEDNQIKLLASPETITFFPGLLAMFSATKDLAQQEQEKNSWVYDHKIRLAWRELFKRFNAEPAHNPVYLKKILFPKYNGGFKTAMIGDKEIYNNFNENLLTCSDLNRPNWLNWFAYPKKIPTKTYDMLYNIAAEKVTWHNIEDAQRAVL